MRDMADPSALMCTGRLSAFMRVHLGEAGGVLSAEALGHSPTRVHPHERGTVEALARCASVSEKYLTPVVRRPRVAALSKSGQCLGIPLRPFGARPSLNGGGLLLFDPIFDKGKTTVSRCDKHALPAVFKLVPLHG